MMENPGQPPLWGAEIGAYSGPGPMESDVIKAITSLNEQAELDPVRKALATVCVSLARNIDLANLKRRAIANEANQLATLLKQLAGIEDGDAGDATPAGMIPQQTQDFIDALATPPRLDTPSASYAP